jgi:hypothetical protein
MRVEGSRNYRMICDRSFYIGVEVVLLTSAARIATVVPLTLLLSFLLHCEFTRLEVTDLIDICRCILAMLPT